jgi:hypothetical protein
MVNIKLTNVNYICASNSERRPMQLCSVKDSVFSSYIVHQIHRPYGKFYLFESYVVSEIEEGVVFGSLQAYDIFALLMEFYDGIKRPMRFVYLSNRIYSYSTKPVDWLDFKFMGVYMIGYGIVDNRERAVQNASIEKNFVPCEIDVFENLSKAINWSMDLQLQWDSN